MANPQHIEWLLEGVEAWNARRERDDFVPEFQSLDIKGSKLNQVNLSNAILRYTDLRDTELRQANFRGADLQSTDLGGASLIEADFEDANLRGTFLKELDLRDANLQGANFQNAYLGGANLSRQNLRKANLSGADLPMANLAGADLTEANLEGADLSRANLDGANLQGANLIGTNIRSFGIGVNKYDSPSPKPMNLQTWKELSEHQINSMLGDWMTILPDGMDRPDHWEKAPEDVGEGEGKQGEADEPEPLNIGFVRAAAIDIDITINGIDTTPADHTLLNGNVATPDLADQVDNAKTIARTTEQIAPDVRGWFTEYAQHLEQVDPPRANRLQFLITAIEAELDDTRSAHYSRALRALMRQFMKDHTDILHTYAPDAVQAIKQIEDTKLSRVPSLADVQKIADGLETTILATEAATDRTRDYLAEQRKLQSEFSAHIAYLTANNKEKEVRLALEQRYKEVASITAKTTYKAQVIKKARLHLGDVVILTSLAGRSVPELAQALIKGLTPIMQQLREFLTFLPPL